MNSDSVEIMPVGQETMSTPGYQHTDTFSTFQRRDLRERYGRNLKMEKLKVGAVKYVLTNARI